jgi:alkylation response protein AidB-like acyl-CoA dehydrogenase
MSTTSLSVLDTLAPIVTSVVAEHAARVDKEGVFPEASITALRDAGLFGLVTAKELGGHGEAHRAATLVVEELAKHCASTAMVMCMHYAGAWVLEKLGPESVRRDIAAGKHLSTLAFSEAGSRSHFWAPRVHRHARPPAGVRLDAKKSWVTSAAPRRPTCGRASPTAAEGVSSTLARAARRPTALRIDGAFDGLGLRGNDSRPVRRRRVPSSPRALASAPTARGFDHDRDRAAPVQRC